MDTGIAVSIGKFFMLFRSETFQKVKIILFGNALGALFGFLVTVLLSRVLNVEDFGRYSYLYALTLILMTMLDFSSGSSFVINYTKYKGSSLIFANYNALRLIATIVIIFGGIFTIFVPIGHLTLTDKLFVLVITLSFLWYLHLQFFYQAVGYFKKYSIALIGNNLFRLLFLLGLVFFVSQKNIIQLNTVFLVVVCAQLTALLINALISLKSGMRLEISFRFDRHFLRTLYYLGIGSVLIILTMRVDNFIIGYYLGYREVGYYTVAFTLSSMFPLITGSLMTVFVRELSLPEKNSHEYMKRFLMRQLKLLIPGVVIALALVLISKPLIEVFFGSRYEPSTPLFKILLFPFCLGIVFTPIESYFYSHQPYIITVLKFVQFVATVLFSVVFIKAFGLIGVGFSTLLVRLIGWVFLPLYTQVQINKMKVNAGALSEGKGFKNF